MDEWFYQGEDVKLVITTNVSIAGNTEIELIIETPNTIIHKKKSLGQITEGSSTEFSAIINSIDTASVVPGLYEYQARVVMASGAVVNCIFNPKVIRLKDTIGD